MFWQHHVELYGIARPILHLFSTLPELMTTWSCSNKSEIQESLNYILNLQVWFDLLCPCLLKQHLLTYADGDPIIPDDVIYTKVCGLPSQLFSWCWKIIFFTLRYKYVINIQDYLKWESIYCEWKTFTFIFSLIPAVYSKIFTWQWAGISESLKRGSAQNSYS